MRVKPTLGWITCSTMPHGSLDDQPGIEELRRRGITILPFDWQGPWVQAQAYLFRTPWNYYKYFSQFQEFLNLLPPDKTMNSVSLIQWNTDKIYLHELQEKGIAIFPTEFLDARSDFLQAMRNLGGPDEVILKPAVSAGSHDTFRVSASKAPEIYRQMAHHSRILLQPFATNVLSEGEFSVHFFKSPGQDSVYSHSIVKKPKMGDFRVQEEFGGSIETIEAPASMLAFARSVIAQIPHDWLYARVDCLRWQNQDRLAELEVFEPQLYLKHSPLAPTLFADAIEQWMKRV